MGKLKTAFVLEENDANTPSKMTGIIAIIGKAPNDRPYLSFDVARNGNLLYHSWMADEDLERFARNILKCLTKTQ